MKNFNFISVSGYGWTGSSVYIALLKEFEGFGSFDSEFRLAKDPNGLIDLESSLVDNWEFIRHDVSIRDFLSYCDLLSRKGLFFSKIGLDFEEKLFVDFMSESEKYIDKLTDLTYIGDSVVHRYRLNAMQFFFKKIKSKLGVYNNTGSMRMARPSKEKFIIETRSYINSLFDNYAKIHDLNTIVLDQAIPISNPFKSMNYFDTIKLIKVDRDPRDTYVNLIKRKKLIGFELSKDKFVDKYILWHKTLRKVNKKSINNKKDGILSVNFEDLFLNYENTIEKLNFFLGGNLNHTNKDKYFDHEILKNKIGLWKSYKDQRSIDKIYEAFPDDCFDI